MITRRGLAFFSFLALVTGCTKPCELPGQHSEDPAASCYYQITVTKVDMDSYLVKGKLPEDLYVKGTKEIIDAREHMSREEFAFRVRDLEKLGKQIEINKTYEFIRQGNSPYFELIP